MKIFFIQNEGGYRDGLNHQKGKIHHTAKTESYHDMIPLLGIYRHGSNMKKERTWGRCTATHKAT